MRRKEEPIKPQENSTDQLDTGAAEVSGEENKPSVESTFSNYVKLARAEIHIPRKVLREDVFRTLSDDEYNLEISLKN